MGDQDLDKPPTNPTVEPGSFPRMGINGNDSSIHVRLEKPSRSALAAKSASSAVVAFFTS